MTTNLISNNQTIKSFPNDKAARAFLRRHNLLLTDFTKTAAGWVYKNSTLALHLTSPAAAAVIPQHPEIFISETEKRAAATRLYNDVKPLMENLYSRWLDEREYENVKDYALPLAQHLEAHEAVLVKMNKRPFGFTFTVHGTEFRLTINQGSYNLICHH